MRRPGRRSGGAASRSATRARATLGRAGSRPLHESPDSSLLQTDQRLVTIYIFGVLKSVYGALDVGR
jgi:hypothetical protein